MSRPLTGAMASEVAKPELAPVTFVEGDFTSGFARMWNGIGPIVWDGKTWLGGGKLLGIGPLGETRDVEATQATVSLSGVDAVHLALAYGEFSQGRPLTIWLGAIDPLSAQIVSDPVQIFSGRMDTIGDADDGSEAVVTITAVSSLTDLKRIRARYLTDQDQQRVFPGDRSLRYMPSLQDARVYWGVDGATPDLAPLP